MKQVLTISWAFVIAGVSTGTATGAFAGSCDKSDDVTTCKGDVYPYYENVGSGSGDIRGFVFKELNADATNGSSGYAISVGGVGDHGSNDGDDGDVGRSVTVNFQGINGDNTYGINSTGSSYEVTSTGGSGHDGKTRSGADDTGGGDAGAGGVGGEVALQHSGGDITALEGWLYESVGGAGGDGGEGSTTSGTGSGGRGGDGGAGAGESTIVFDTKAVTLESGQLVTRSVGGAGGQGGKGKSTAGEAKGGRAGNGGDGGDISFVLNTDVSFEQYSGTSKVGGIGVVSQGADGGKGGTATGTASDSYAGNGGNGGAGGAVDIQSNQGAAVDISATGTAVLGASVAGNGGDGGDGDSSLGKAKGGDGRVGGTGGAVTITLTTSNENTIQTSGDQAHGILGQSIGGSGGDGGNGSGGLAGGSGGAGDGSGPGGDVTIAYSGALVTNGSEANGIAAQSLGGYSGDAGKGTGLMGYGSGSQSAGGGATVKVTTKQATSIETQGDYSDGIFAQSVGGGGGRGSSGDGLTAMGGSGSAGGNGGSVTVTTNNGTTTSANVIKTNGQVSHGIQAQSIGGAGGSGGGSKGLTSFGGDAGSGGSGATVTVNNYSDVVTAGSQSLGILAQSTGGGGGNAHSTSGMESFGGSGGDGGNGGSVTVNNNRGVTTSADDSVGVSVQSTGGGGGHGSSAFSSGAEFSASFGGSGGDGGHGGTTKYNNTQAENSTVSTKGDRATAIHVQSTGGGGGHGGYAITANGGFGLDMTMGVSGDGGTGGDGGAASASVSDDVTTAGDQASALVVQSTGGGGGYAGTTISSANAAGISSSVALGGSGGAGGDGDDVSAWIYSGKISTEGDNSDGISAQSTGGGGGRSGMTIAATAVSGMNTSLAIGGQGGAGGDAGTVVVKSEGSGITVAGAGSDGILAQSTGGSGGVAKMVIASSGATQSTALNLAIGGDGGEGGNGNTVNVQSYSSINVTDAQGGSGIIAQSIGGGGGHGSMTVAGSLASTQSISLALGGTGGKGGNAGNVTVGLYSDITTAGSSAYGVLAQSQAGNGGNGGASIAADGTSMSAVNVSISGSGANGGTAGDVNVSLNKGKRITTSGMYSQGIKATSNGGGGGNATMAISGTVASLGGEVSVAVGGAGGAGGTAGNVSVTLDDATGIFTSGDFADGLFAASQGGGGGHGAMSITGSMSGGEYTSSTNVSVGGGGGGGGKAGKVTVNNSWDEATATAPSIQTTGYQSRGITASSIGGNGGMGGAAFTGSLNFSSEVGMSAGVSVGGDGGSGAAGGAVEVINLGSISTQGHYSDGILAISVGGDGGIGGNAVAAAITTTESNSSNFEAAIGGSGGSGSVGGDVTVANTGDISTLGLESTGVYAQSIGGGGGRGGNAGTAIFNYSASQEGNSDKTMTMNVQTSVGGTGGNGRHGGSVSVTNDGNITVGYEATDSAGNQIADRMAYGIFAQSIGGGGGDGGSVSAFNMTVVGDCTFNKDYLPSEVSCSSGDDPEDSPKSTYAPNATLEIGGNGGNAGNGDTAAVSNSGKISTSGTGSYGIFAQSTGGGGGTGGGGSMGLEYILPSSQYTEVLGYMKTALDQTVSNSRSYQKVSLIVGGQGGSAGDGGDVTVTNTGTVTTTGFTADAIQALSTGGGGGNGGTAYTGLGSPGIEKFAVGGTGSGGGDGGDITIYSSGKVETTGIDAMGIFAQSVGGGGGRAGAVSRSLVGELGVDMNVGFTVGGTLEAGNGGDGGDISVTIDAGSLTTTGIRSHGIWAQSVGGSGGASSWGGGIEDAENEAISFAGGAGDYGAGGDVSVTINGALSVSGTSAVGVFGQSVSGADMVTQDDGQKAGAVTATINGSVTATGAAGRGIFLQSQGLNGNGKLYVDVAGGASIIAGSQTSEAILLGSGNSENTIDNHGTISRSETGDGAVQGYAVKTHDGVVTVNNYGIFEGSVSLVGEKDNGSSVTNAFNNINRLSLGTIFDLGNTASTLNNTGLMTAGAFGEVGTEDESAIGTSTFTGTVNQGSEGTLWVDYDFSSNGDLIDVTSGSATLDGVVYANPVADVPTDQEDGAVTVLMAPTGSIAAESLEITDSAVVDYSLVETKISDTQDGLVLSYDVNYAAWESVPQTTTVNETEVPVADLSYDNLNNLYTVVDYIDILARFRNEAVAEGSTEFDNVGDFFAPLLTLQSVDDVVDIYQHLASGDLLQLSNASLQSSYRFADSLMSCPEENEDGRISYRHQGSCAWFAFGGLTRDVDGTAGSIAFDENTWDLSAGAQVEFADGWFVGGALSYEDVSYSTSISGGDGSRYHLGGVLKREIGNQTFALSASGGKGDYSLQRAMLGTYGIQSDSDTIDNNWIAVHGRFSQYIPQNNNWFIEPFLDLGMTWMQQDAVEIGGSLPFDVAADSSKTTTYSINPGIEFGRSVETANGPLDMRFGVGFLGLFGNDFSTNLSAFDHASEVGTFSSSADFDDRFVELKADISGQIGKRTSIKLSVGGLIGQNDRTFGGDVRISYQF